MLRVYALLLSLFTPPAFASTQTHVIFGDSLSDEGRLYQATAQQFPPSPFFEGRFSNGPVWAEHLQGERANYAFSGAKSDYSNMLTSKLGEIVDHTGLFAQLDQYFEEHGELTDPAGTRYYITIGANDFLALVEGGDTDLERFIPDIVDNIIASAKRLRKAGATDILLVGLPDLSQIPMANNMSHKEQKLIALASRKFNVLLESQSSHHDLKFYELDVFMAKITSRPEQYGLTNVEDACYDEITNIVCDNPDEYVYWDSKHPTTKVHQLFAKTLKSS